MTIDQFNTLIKHRAINVKGLCDAAGVSYKNIRDYIEGRRGKRGMKPETGAAIISVLSELHEQIGDALQPVNR